MKLVFYYGVLTETLEAPTSDSLFCVFYSVNFDRYQYANSEAGFIAKGVQP
jgi:hypothetical protein